MDASDSALVHAWPARLWLDASRVPNASAVGRGAKFDVALEGLLDARSGAYGLWVESAPEPRLPEPSLPEPSEAMPPLASPEAIGGELSVASLNVHNLKLEDPASKFEHFARLVVSQLQSPDLLALQEVQDDSGSANDGVTTSRQTLARLVSEIEAQGGPRYEAVQLAPMAANRVETFARSCSITRAVGSGTCRERAPPRPPPTASCRGPS
jgi:hypothetical protein